MSAVWLLMLIAAVAVGFYLLHWRQDEVPSPAELQEEDARISPLLRGINYLLSDEPDRALQELVQVARLRSEAAEVYMALGEMFRSKGEIGRAVRIHQNILARPDVTRDLHLQAHLALGRDFQAGGLLDRSLNHYRKALEIRPDHADALVASLRIREQSHEWIEAEALLSRIEQMRGDTQHQHRSYLFAQMADDALKAGEMDEAEACARRALHLYQGCAHAHLVLIALFIRQHNWEGVADQVRSLVAAAPEHVAQAVPLLLDAGKREQLQMHTLLLECWQQTRDEELALTWLEETGHRGKPDAVAALRAELEFRPSGLRASLRDVALQSDQMPAPLAEQAIAWRKNMKRFACAQCGVRVVDLRWQCPQCHTWGSMHAIREDGLT